MNQCTEWRPPDWREIEEGVNPTPQECADLYDVFKAKGYYTRGGTLSKKGSEAADSEEASIVRHNVALLRDAWNTYGGVWDLAALLTGVDFVVDPFNNPGMSASASKLLVRLDGTGDQSDSQRPTNGLAVSDKLVEIKTFVLVNGKVEEKTLALPLPLNWRGHGKRKLKPGTAHALVNGPHSDTAKWIKLCAAQGQQEIVAAFVPCAGDGWFQQWSLTAQLIVSLGRVPCIAPPGIKSSSPRGASALLIWVPEHLVSLTPPKTRKCITKGANFRVPLLTRPKAGVQYAMVQSGNMQEIVDMGLTS